MFTGSLVAIVTPMRLDGSVDPEAWERLLDWHLAAGTAGVVIGGTTGESVTLTDAELAELVGRACARLRGRLPVIAGVGGSNTAAVVERARALGRSGADALLVVTPAYNRPTQEGLYRHFAAVAGSAGVPGAVQRAVADGRRPAAGDGGAAGETAWHRCGQRSGAVNRQDQGARGRRRSRLRRAVGR
jgi:dihydrodipicolinate synthase/N-acetylneuraminate lyase